MNSRTLLQKLLSSFLTLFIMASITFFLLRLLPGGPFDSEKQVSPEILENLNARFHLNQPLWQQYINFLTQLLHGDLGPSYKYLTRNVNDIVREGLFTSFSIGGLAFILGVSLGTLSALLESYTSFTPLKRVLSFCRAASLATPAFIFGAVLLMIFSFQLGWLPAARLISPAHFVLPVLTLALNPFALTSSLLYDSIETSKQEPFILIKRAFGLPAWWVYCTHLLKHACYPVLSILGPMAATLLTGSFAVEWLFALPGLGKFFVNSVIDRDYTVVMGITLVYGMILIVLNAFADLLNHLMDPRSGKGSS
jgi:oligopeptide transport system permease protein